MAERRSQPEVELEVFETSIDYHFEEAWSAVKRGDRSRLLLELQEAGEGFARFIDRVERSQFPQGDLPAERFPAATPDAGEAADGS